MKTYSVKAKEIIREWHLIDATDKVLGKVATEAAELLMGKNKTMFTRNMDTGDYVVVINAAYITVTGSKTTDKTYYKHSGYPGGLKSVTLKDQLKNHPDRVIRDAVWGMLPKTKFSHAIIKRLKVYGGGEHPHGTQVEKK